MSTAVVTATGAETGEIADTRRQRRELIPSPVLAMAIFLFTEVMLFAGLISSYIVLRGQAAEWPPFDQPRLPVLATAAITLLLLGSGFTMWRSVPALTSGNERAFRRLMAITFGLGAAFVLLQGAEWAVLVSYGLTSSSSLYGSLFYTLVGCHAVHVVVALIALGVIARRARNGRYTAANHAGLRAMRMYWTFVVVVWPPLYALVYLW